MMAKTTWQQLPVEVRRALTGAVAAGVPPLAIGFSARWWQLETWLRELVYMEFRAAYGSHWLDRVSAHASARAEKDTINFYMASPDASSVLAYLDVGYLFKLIDDDENWPLFEPSLLPRTRWRGVVDELGQLRNRSAHCRRPHSDDLHRVEQVLRDLEPGARLALESYNIRGEPAEALKDAVVASWLRREHPAASRLVDHATTQYETRFRLSYSRRPWVSKRRKAQPITGQTGFFWHAEFHMVGGRALRPRDFWSNSYVQRRQVQDVLVHVVMTDGASIEVTFSTADDPTAVSDAIGACFDAVLLESRAFPTTHNLTVDVRNWERWLRDGEDLDSRIHLGDALALAHPDTPFPIFSASR